MLREEENKYCADCEAKQPRWASWNLGVFLCIRCAGLHRNLGVHISKVAKFSKKKFFILKVLGKISKFRLVDSRTNSKRSSNGQCQS